MSKRQPLKPCLRFKMPMNAHDANHPKIMTRDVKPENFLVGLPGTPTESIIHMVHNVDIRGNDDCVCANIHASRSQCQ